jgi:CheY-like chemotaxis protein
MRLNFNILWFEDTPEIIDGIEEPVAEHLGKQGYYLKRVDILKDSTRLREIIDDVNEKKLDVDLILMDNNLAGGDKGSELIGTIRRHELLTDIIFYSEHRGFRDKLDQYDGIYTSDRDDLEQKIIAVTDHILKKALDLANLRGLVMAETSELEELMRKIILTALEKGVLISPEKIRRDIKKRLKRRLKGRNKDLEKLVVDGDEPSKPFDFAEMLDFDGKSKTLEELLENYSKQIKQDDKIDSNRIDLTHESFDHKAFQVEVIKKRNNLAHLKESTNQDGRKILKANKKGQEDFVFDTQTAFDIRKNLRKYYDILTGIYKAVTGKDWN